MLVYDVIIIGGGPAGSLAAYYCAKNGLRVAIIEREEISSKQKPCGGILTSFAYEFLSENISEIPREVLAKPKILCLQVQLPTGNSYLFRNCQLTNVNRSEFDKWLLELCADKGVTVFSKTCFSSFLKANKKFYVKIRNLNDGSSSHIICRYIIGADGVFSTLRKQVFGEGSFRKIFVVQEEWKGDGAVRVFHMYFNKSLSQTYLYLIPKSDIFLIGGGELTVPSDLATFRITVSKIFKLKLDKMLKRSRWAIPYYRPVLGHENILLTGDAAGFCNAFSGEGLRFAIESGLRAGEAVLKAEDSGKNAILFYRESVKHLVSYVKRTHKIMDKLLKLRNDELNLYLKNQLYLVGSKP